MPKKYNKRAVEHLRRRMREDADTPPMNRKNKPMSNLERMVADMLDDLKIEWEREVPLKYLQGYRYYDFRLIGYNVMIEVDGSYWHGERDKPSYLTLMAKKNDMIKSWLAKKEGYELIRIKEKQLKEEYNAVVENISLVTNKEGEQEDE